MTEDELFDDIRYWKGRADAANAEVDRLRSALRDVMNASNDPYEIAKNALADMTKDRKSKA